MFGIGPISSYDYYKLQNQEDEERPEPTEPTEEEWWDDEEDIT